MALIVRPPRPMILPMSSGATLISRSTRESDSAPETSTLSGSSTSERARTSTRFSSSATTTLLENPGDLQQLAHLVRGLRALLEPLPRLLLVHLDVRRLRARVVRPDAVYKAPVARAARIRDHYPVEGRPLRTVPREPDLYRHLFTSPALELSLSRPERHLRNTALAHLLHHLLHLVELRYELLDVLLGTPGAAGDPTHPARVLQELRVSPLLDGHGCYHGLHPVQHPIVQVHALKLLAQARNHAQKPRERAHPLEHLHLLEEVLEGELPTHEPSGIDLSLFAVHLLLGLLYEGEYVPHAEDATRHAIRVEVVELAHLLALGGEPDRALGHRDHRQCCPAPRVAVELGEHHPVEVRVVLECLRDLDRVLPRHNVQNEKHRVRLRSLPHPLELLHHLHVHDLPARGVYDDEVVAAVPGCFDAALGDLLRRRLHALGIHRHPELAPDLLELVYRRRAVRVAGDEIRTLAELPYEEGELASHRRFAVPVQSREHHDRRRPGGERELVGRAAHQVRKLLVDDLDYLLAGAERLGDLGPGRPLADFADEFLDDGVVDVRLQQRELYLPRDLLYLVLGEVSAAAHPVERRIEPLSQRLEHALQIPKQSFGELARVEGVQILDPLPHGDELYRDPDLVGYSQRYAALGRAVELGQDDPRDPRDLVEHPGLPQTILTRRCIYCQQDLVRRARELPPDDPPYLVELCHQVDLRMEPARRVHEEHVNPIALGRLHRIVGYRRSIRAALPGHHRSPRPLAPLLELLYGRRPERVACGEHSSAGQKVDQLADRRGLPRTVHADHQDHGRFARYVEFDRTFEHTLGVLDHELPQLAAARDVLLQRLLLELPDELGGGRNAHVGLPALFQPQPEPPEPADGLLRLRKRLLFGLGLPLGLRRYTGLLRLFAIPFEKGTP